MTKTYFLLPLLLLGGCYTGNNVDNTTSDRETLFESSDMEYVAEDTGLSTDPVIMPTQSEEDQQAVIVPTQAAEPAEPVQSVMPQPTQSAQPTLSSDGTMIELPAQQIYIGTASAPAPAPIQQPNPYAPYPIAYSAPATIQQPPQPAYTSDVVILQYTAYPNTFVQCPATDGRCIAAYEQQGFVQLQNKPRFAGYREVVVPSDYPAGRWRSGNNIPRW